MRKLITIAVAAVAAVAVATPASATPPQPVVLALNGVFTGPNTIAGTWSATGAFTDSGTYTETFRLTGNDVHTEKVLVGSQGTIVLDVNAIVVWTSPTTATFRAGAWRVASGTGAYARLHARGSPGATDAFADTVGGVITVTHAGTANFD
jgi:hypothetical protein